MGERAKTIIEVESHGMRCKNMEITSESTGVTYLLCKDSLIIAGRYGSQVNRIEIPIKDLYHYEDDLFHLAEIWQKYIAGEPKEGTLIRIARRGEP